MSDPITNPKTRDFYTLDGVISPGQVELTSGGERDLSWQKQQGVLTVGASTILRYEEIAEVEFTHRLWQPAQFVAFDVFATMLIAAVNVRPVRAWVIGCERLKHCGITAVSLRLIGPELGNRGGPFTRKVKLIAYKRPKPFGGAAQAPKNAVEQAIVNLGAENRNLDQQLAAAQKAARAGK